MMSCLMVEMDTLYSHFILEPKKYVCKVYEMIFDIHDVSSFCLNCACCVRDFEETKTQRGPLLEYLLSGYFILFVVCLLCLNQLCSRAIVLILALCRLYTRAKIVFKCIMSSGPSGTCLRLYTNADARRSLAALHNAAR